jgi:polysaccharide pyruvyl transferase WcaK-like protein
VTRRLLLIADVGGLGSRNRWHVGDEAMLAATLSWLGREAPETEVVVGSTAPSCTQRLYRTRAVRFLDFGDDTSPLQARTLCQDVLSRVSRAPGPGSPAARDRTATDDLIAVMRSVDGLLFCGAGNLSSAFPNRMYERLATAGVARALGKPYAFSAQTIGPLRPDDTAHVRAALTGASYVGARDPDSLAELGRLGIDAVPMADDALHHPLPRPQPVAGRRIGVTLHRSPLADQHYDMAALAAALNTTARDADASVHFIPHFRGPGGRWSDLECAAELASHLRVPLSIGPWAPPAAVLAETAGCCLVISTRYHPLVFAARAGVPAIALHQDPYHRAKQAGILDACGTPEWTFPAQGDGPARAAALGLALVGDASAGPSLLDRSRRVAERDSTIRRERLARLGGGA